MQPVLLPLFPLQVVLLPGAELPLHIFEDRYKEMIGEVLRGNLAFGREFGVVLASEKGIVNIGCTATVEQVLRQYPDGRMDLLTRGRRRFEIVRLNDERAFLRASVDFFDDDVSEPATPEIQKRAIDGYSQLQALSESTPPGSPSPSGSPEAMGPGTSPEAIGLPDANESMNLAGSPEGIDRNDPQLSFRLAQPVPDLGFRQTLLATRSEAERLRQLADFLPGYLHRQRRIQHMKEVAPKNGHGGGHTGGSGHGPSGIE
jgi:hypothetical protein